MISVFRDATFEAKFSVDNGDGSVYGPIAGIKPPADKWALLDALVHKYAPIYMLNVDEVYWQSTIDAFLPNMILQKAANNSGQGLSTFYDGPMNRNVLAEQAKLLGAANTNTMAFLRRSASPVSFSNRANRLCCFRRTEREDIGQLPGAQQEPQR